MFKYPPEIRTLIYTTNAIENFNRQLRKVTKTKSAFVSDDALMKILYLATINITEKWTMPIRNWGTILDHLMIISATGCQSPSNCISPAFGLYTEFYALPIFH